MGYQVPEVEIPSVKLSRGRLRYLTVEEEQRLLEAVDPRRDVKGLAPYEDHIPRIKTQMQDVHDFIIILLDTGARHGEICTLEWSQINFTHRSIALWRSKVKNESILFMSDRVFDVLSRRYANRNSTFVFTDSQGSARACPRFCVNGLMAGNCRDLQRKRNDRKQRIDRPPVGGLQKA